MTTNPYERIQELEAEVERLKGLCQVDRDTVEGAIDCLKSYLRNEDCDYETEWCGKGCSCADLTIIKGLEEALKTEGE